MIKDCHVLYLNLQRRQSKVRKDNVFVDGRDNFFITLLDRRYAFITRYLFDQKNNSLKRMCIYIVIFSLETLINVINEKYFSAMTLLSYYNLLL